MRKAAATLPAKATNGCSCGGGAGVPFYFCVTRISIRRFRWRPSSVALSATGNCSPYPSASNLARSIPRLTISFMVFVARSAESFRFAASSPTLSVYPPILTFAPADRL